MRCSTAAATARPERGRKVTQVLAGGTQLVHRMTAPVAEGGFSDAAKAILLACGDLRRVGHDNPLPLWAIRGAAPGYLDPPDLDPAAPWFNRAWEDITQAAKQDDPNKVWALEDILKRGEKVYGSNCAACHQANGKGAGPIKPLDGSAVVRNADHGVQIQIVLRGVANGAMPSWKALSDTDLAAVITYTKNAWSNKTGQLVQPAEIVAQRSK